MKRVIIPEKVIIHEFSITDEEYYNFLKTKDITIIENKDIEKEVYLLNPEYETSIYDIYKESYILSEGYVCEINGIRKALLNEAGRYYWTSYLDDWNCYKPYENASNAILDVIEQGGEVYELTDSEEFFEYMRRRI